MITNVWYTLGCSGLPVPRQRCQTAPFMMCKLRGYHCCNCSCHPCNRRKVPPVNTCAQGTAASSAHPLSWPCLCCSLPSCEGNVIVWKLKDGFLMMKGWTFLNFAECILEAYSKVLQLSLISIFFFKFYCFYLSFYSFSLPLWIFNFFTVFIILFHQPSLSPSHYNCPMSPFPINLCQRLPEWHRTPWGDI